MAKNLEWKKFENKCARDFGGVGRFPANQGGRLDFESPFAIGQCKTLKLSAARASYSVAYVAKLCTEIYRLAQADPARTAKWPMVCVKVRRGPGVKSEALFCLSTEAADSWIGSKAVGLFALYEVMKGAGSVENLTRRLEEETSDIGVRVRVGRRMFVACARSRFLEAYAFKAARRAKKQKQKAA